jgi:hypothetical protein
MSLWYPKKNLVIPSSLYVVDRVAKEGSADPESVHEPEEPSAELTVVDTPADDNPESDPLEDIHQPEEAPIDYEPSPQEDETGNFVEFVSN